MRKNFLTKIATTLYTLGVRRRLKRYRTGRLTVRKLNSPVISVGNISVGGTGKTPCTAFIANFLQADGLQVAILSRGYKRQSKGLVEVSNGREILCDAGQAGDEPYLLAQLCPGVRVVVNADRYEAGKWLESQTSIDVFILDDGYQHIQLHRDLNLLLLDGREPFGDAIPLPYGNLREPVEEINRADAILATRMDGDARRDVFRGIHYLLGKSRAPIFFSTHEITGFRLLNNATPLAQLKQQKCAAFSGIAQPARFFEDLQQKKLTLVYQQSFRDHHRYSADEVLSLSQKAIEHQAAALITTEKDAANLPGEVLQQISLPVYAAQLKLRIENQTEFKRLVRQKIKR